MACHILGAPNMALYLSHRKLLSVECIKKEGVSPFMFPKGSVIRFDFAAYGNMPALKVFWYDGLKETPQIAGVPKGEWLGDPPSLPRPKGASAPAGGRGAAAPGTPPGGAPAGGRGAAPMRPADDESILPAAFSTGRSSKP